MPRGKQIIVGCRGDALSTLHCERACDALREVHPHAEFAIAGGNGGRIDPRRAATALLQRISKGEVDLGILDGRWVPIQLPSTVEIVAVLERTNPFDVLISCEDLILDEQPDNVSIAVIDSVTRGQLLYYRPDLKIVEKSDGFERLFDSVRSGSIAAFVYPAADVEALNQQEHVAEVFTTSICTPPGGQGAQVLLALRDRRDMGSLVRDLNDPSAEAELELERMLLEQLARDGRGPVGVLGNVEGTVFELEAAIAAIDGTEKISATVGGTLAERAKIVTRLAAELLASGGDEILAPYRRARNNG